MLYLPTGVRARPGQRCGRQGQANLDIEMAPLSIRDGPMLPDAPKQKRRNKMWPRVLICL